MIEIRGDAVIEVYAAIAIWCAVPGSTTAQVEKCRQQASDCMDLVHLSNLGRAPTKGKVADCLMSEKDFCEKYRLNCKKPPRIDKKLTQN